MCRAPRAPLRLNGQIPQSQKEIPNPIRNEIPWFHQSETLSPMNLVQNPALSPSMACINCTHFISLRLRRVARRPTFLTVHLRILHRLLLHRQLFGGWSTSGSDILSSPFLLLASDPFHLLWDFSIRVKLQQRSSDMLDRFKERCLPYPSPRRLL